MKKNILAENMRRFGTKNLTEQNLNDLENKLGFDSGANRDPKTGNMKKINWSTLEFEDTKTDPYVSYAEYEDGTPLNNEELEILMHNHSELVHEKLWDYLN